MDQSGSSQDISSKVVIKDELDLDCEDCYTIHGRSNKGKIKQESYSLMSISGAEYDNSDMKKENDFVVDDYEKRCCVWLKENPAPVLLQEPNLPLLSLPEGTEIIKLKPVNYTKPLRFQNNRDIKVSSNSKDLYRKEKRARKHEFEAIGVIWASKLLRLEETQRVLAEDLINKILKKGFFKDLTPNTTLYDCKYRV